MLFEGSTHAGNTAGFQACELQYGIEAEWSQLCDDDDCRPYLRYWIPLHEEVERGQPDVIIPLWLAVLRPQGSSPGFRHATHYVDAGKVTIPGGLLSEKMVRRRLVLLARVAGFHRVLWPKYLLTFKVTAISAHIQTLVGTKIWSPVLELELESHHHYAYVFEFPVFPGVPRGYQFSLGFETRPEKFGRFLPGKAEFRRGSNRGIEFLVASNDFHGFDLGELVREMQMSSSALPR